MRRSLAPAVPMPDPLIHYWTMWNEPDLDAVRRHLDAAVSTDFVFVDPRHHHIGRDALEANVRALRTDKPRYRFVIASELDGHHDCYRYEWHMTAGSRTLLQGFDVARVGTDGLLERVDGFFGALAPVAAADSLVPEFLRAPT
ncbi:MAG: nuclear transport factor 2 family protein [Actinomycetota bacterium]